VDKLRLKSLSFLSLSTRSAHRFLFLSLSTHLCRTQNTASVTCCRCQLNVILSAELKSARPCEFASLCHKSN